MASEDEEFTTLFQDFYPSLCRFLECLLGGRAALAQDLAQESFLQLHRSAWTGLPAGEARFWLYRVARNLAINEFRKGQTRYRLFEQVVQVMRPRRRNPEEEYETQERQEIVLEMLQSLPEDQRTALLLREQEQLSYREIGHVLNISESKVKIDIFEPARLYGNFGPGETRLTAHADIEVMFMGCDQTEKLSLLIDGELATEDAPALELHLSTCSECNQVRADFLGLRHQISSYTLSGHPTLVRPALAKVLSKSRWRSAQTGRRGRFLGVGALRFNAQLAAVAAVVLLTLAIGTIAFLRYRQQPGVASGNTTARSQGITQSSGTQEETDQLAKNSGRKPPKAQPRETGPGDRKPNSRTKPARERSAPKPLPQLQNVAPPTYAFVNGSNGASDPASITEAASHFEQSELLLRAFRNLRPARAGGSPQIAYERRRAQELLYRNIMLRREADNEGDVQVATLLTSLEPILLDIANLRDRPRSSEVQMIKERVERTSLVPLLQVNSMAVARAN